jgi:uncharacterized protein (DUF2126 family)
MFYTDRQWQTINALGHQVEEKLRHLGVGLLMGGEPTFVSLDDFESPQWRTEALGSEKRQIAGQLLRQLAQHFAHAGGVLHYGLGKVYPGEDLPRWALGYFWRKDGVPLWRNCALIAHEDIDYSYGQAEARAFIGHLCKQLGIHPDCILSAYERETEALAGYCLPLLPVSDEGKIYWRSCRWLLPEEKLYLLKGSAPLGLRLPLQALDEPTVLETEAIATLDDPAIAPCPELLESPPNSIRIALGVEVRQGVLHLFLPPLSSTRGFVDLLAAIEQTAEDLDIPVLLEGYAPPVNAGIQGFQITPDPGVIEVNIHPAASWQELVQVTTLLYSEARQCRLGTDKYLWDGRRVSTGGGAHITIGGQSVGESPLLRRPDLLRSLISYFQNHPSLSFLFCDQFVGPTSQSPRVDEARHESLYELEIAFQALQPQQEVPPEAIDHLLRHLLVDVTGNTHRTAFCIDKLFPWDNCRNQLGLLEFRAFAMPPDLKMRLLQMLLIRALVAWFWERPYTKPLIRWGTALHDRFLLPHYIQTDLRDVLHELQEAGYAFEASWFEPFVEFRFPRYGTVVAAGVELELRHAIEPWLVLGEAVTSGRTSRPVDDSLERIQVTLRGAMGNSPNGDTFAARYAVTCLGRAVPLKSTGIPGEYVGGVRFRARQYATVLHPAIQPHNPLSFEIVDTWQARSLGGCTYYTTSPSGKIYDTLPTQAQEAQRRREERFLAREATPGSLHVSPLPLNPEYPLTLDLRRVN